MIRFSKLLFVLFSIVFLMLAGFVFAERQLEADYPAIGGWKPTEITRDILPNYVNYIFNFSIGISGLIALAVLIYSGFRYLTSAGSPVAQKDAKNQIFSAILGITILLSSYLILTTINPQLVIINLPFEETEISPPTIEFPKPGDNPLFAQEIPLGRLIENALELKKLNKAKEIVKETKDAAKILQKSSEELKALMDKCQCSILDRGSCETGSCDSPSCVSHCVCTGDPCPNREEINAKIPEVEDKIKALNTVLDSTQEKDKKSGLKEVKGISEKDLQNLLLAEELMKKCGFTPLSYDNLLSLRETQKIEIKKVEGWENIKIGGDAATFYCLSAIESQETNVISDWFLTTKNFLKNPIEDVSAQKEYSCGSEIPIGEAIDDTQALLKKIIEKLQTVLDSSLAEIKAAEILIKLPDQCTSAGCSNKIEESWGGCCGDCCCGCCEPPPPDDGDGEPPPGAPPGGTPPPAASPPAQDSGDWFDFWFFNPSPPYVYAQGCDYGCCDPCCCYNYCDSCSCSVCSGDPCPVAEIANQMNQIKNSFSKMETAEKELIDLLEKLDKVILGKTQRERILDKLNSSRVKLEKCISPLRDIEEIAEGEKSAKWLWSCSQAIEQDLVNDCYSANEEFPDRMDNFLCCE